MDQQVKQTGSYTTIPALFKANIRTLTRITLIVFAILVIGSYAFQWNWTGFDHNTLFQWLKLLFVPVVVASAPVWFSSHPRLQARWSRLFASSLLALAVLLVASLVFNWNWTGFRSATLWDWLNLLLLPLALSALMIWVSMKPAWQPQWTALPIALLLFLAVTIIGGYFFNWKWTGFRGNTLWDWLNLLVLPFVLPAVVLWFGAQQSQPTDAGSKPLAPEPTAAGAARSAPPGSTPTQKPPEDGKAVVDDTSVEETVRLSEIEYLLEGDEGAGY